MTKSPHGIRRLFIDNRIVITYCVRVRDFSLNLLNIGKQELKRLGLSYRSPHFMWEQRMAGRDLERRIF